MLDLILVNCLPYKLWKSSVRVQILYGKREESLTILLVYIPYAVRRLKWIMLFVMISYQRQFYESIWTFKVLSMELTETN